MRYFNYLILLHRKSIMDLKKYDINFDDFDLPFLKITSNDLDDQNEEGELDFDEIKENMKSEYQSKLPASTIYLGAIDSEIENWTNWKIEEYYYIYPLAECEFDWALFRLSWDDNWENWGWSFDARIKGFKENHIEAAKVILGHLFEQWQINLNDKENLCYKQLYSSL